MSNRVVFIHGSPRRKGNTLALAGEAMAELNAMGVETGLIDAPRLDFKHPGCIACYKCQGSQDFGCHVDDELARAVATLPQYDAVVLAAPVYWFGWPAQVKMFIDRVFSLIKFGENHEIFSPLKGKPFGLLATAGGVIEKNLEVLEQQWAIPAARIGSPFLSCLFPMCHYPPGEAANDLALAAKARRFAQDLGTMIA